MQIGRHYPRLGQGPIKLDAVGNASRTRVYGSICRRALTTPRKGHLRALRRLQSNIDVHEAHRYARAIPRVDQMEIKLMINITGLYTSSEKAAHAIRLLKDAGVPPDDISLIASQDIETEGLVEEPHSKAPQGFAIGAAGGGAVGGLVAGLAAVGTIASGGAGLGLIVAGPIVAALAGAGAGAAAGSIVGGMVGAAIPETELNAYEQAIKEGSVLIGVNAEDPNTREIVKAALEIAGAEKVVQSAKS